MYKPCPGGDSGVCKGVDLFARGEYGVAGQVWEVGWSVGGGSEEVE